MKTIEQLRQEASGYAIRETTKQLPLVTEAGNDLVLRLRLEHIIERAFLAGWQASRDGVQ